MNHPTSLAELAVFGLKVFERHSVASGLRQHHRYAKPADRCADQDPGVRSGLLISAGKRLQCDQDRKRVLLRPSGSTLRTKVHLRRPGRRPRRGSCRKDHELSLLEDNMSQRLGSVAQCAPNAVHLDVWDVCRSHFCRSDMASCPFRSLSLSLSIIILSVSLSLFFLFVCWKKLSDIFLHIFENSGKLHEISLEFNWIKKHQFWRQINHILSLFWVKKVVYLDSGQKSRRFACSNSGSSFDFWLSDNCWWTTVGQVTEGWDVIIEKILVLFFSRQLWVQLMNRNRAKFYINQTTLSTRNI